jgi:gamma-glutamyltranspeptidase
MKDIDMEATETVSARDALASQAKAALIEAQLMGESIAALTEALHDCEPEAKAFSLLNAIQACLTRLHAAVDPAVEGLQSARA